MVRIEDSFCCIKRQHKWKALFKIILYFINWSREQLKHRITGISLRQFGVLVLKPWHFFLFGFSHHRSLTHTPPTFCWAKKCLVNSNLCNSLRKWEKVENVSLCSSYKTDSGHSLLKGVTAQSLLTASLKWDVGVHVCSCSSLILFFHSIYSYFPPTIPLFYFLLLYGLFFLLLFFLSILPFFLFSFSSFFLLLVPLLQDFFLFHLFHFFLFHLFLLLHLILFFLFTITIILFNKML